MYVTVAYSLKTQQWHGGYTAQWVDEDGEIERMGGATVEFGPFDSSIEVGYWLASLAKPLRHFQALATHPDPPDYSGKDSPPA